MSDITVSAAVLGVASLCSISAVRTLALQLKHREPRSAWYEDADGKSTPEAVAAFSTSIPKMIVLFLATTGCALSIAVSVLETLFVDRSLTFLVNWLTTTSWSLIGLQAVSIWASHDSMSSYYQGMHTLLSALLVAALRIQHGSNIIIWLWHYHKLLFTIRLAELVTAFALAAAAISLPRRPDVFDYRGRRVNRELSVSFFSRMLFSWADPLLELAAKKKDLEMADMDRPSHKSRADCLSKTYQQQRTMASLWKNIIRLHIGNFAVQWTLAIITSFLNFAPQWCVLNLLRGLEARYARRDDSLGPEVWTWVIWLGLSIVAQSWVENYLFWLSWCNICIPIRAQLSTLIFEKSMRRKDVKSAKKKVPEEVDSSTKNGKTKNTEDKDDNPQKTKQGTVNLIGVDAKRVAVFGVFNFFMPGSIFKMTIALIFLTKLLGIRALLAGLSSMLLLAPVNFYVSKRYANLQDRLMKIRDQKLAVVTEALQGIRQIKFAALEPQWENKINTMRQKELKSVWDVMLTDIVLISIWFGSPIILAATSLSVYAVIEGPLTPSVAFVSLGVFKALELTLSVVPELITDALDAWTSIKRIDEYLSGVELKRIMIESPEVAFYNATVSWPTDEDIQEEERFTLQNLNLRFPSNELSVISGKTGTGKSLLLSAILGEADLIAGKIGVPSAPPLLERHDDKANSENWIIDGAIAYVAQIPWIENATIRDNIIFGLPFDEARYKATVEACALKKDLEMLSDGELTEIGANGINLSGGQKWRITLARAIYSRAAILIMDDIFSAVDAHVGRHIFEKCLCGPLGQGRTRILVTHHVALCVPKTKYLVELADGQVLYAGLVSDLRERGVLNLIQNHEQAPGEIDEDEREITAVNSEESDIGDRIDGEAVMNGNTLQKVTSKQPMVPKKFVEDEKRDTGAVKPHVYTAFFRESGSYSFWAVLVLIFILVQGIDLARAWWLKIWTGNNEDETNNAAVIETSMAHISTAQNMFISSFSVSSNEERGVGFYLGIYVGLAIVWLLLGTVRDYISYVGSIRASKRFFEKVNFAVLRAPLRWLDTVPVGRVLNRFTADFDILDSKLMTNLIFAAFDFLRLVSVVVAGIFVSPFIVLLASILLTICLYFAMRYLNGARPSKRLESTSKSPVFEIFGSALSGVATIRAFDQASIFVTRMHEKIDDYSTTTWYLWLFNRWMSLRMALVGSFFAAIVATIILISPNMEPSLAGFALSFALEFSVAVMWTVRHYSMIELNMNSTERIVEYSTLPTESLNGISPPASWPTEGRIEVKDLVVGYDKELPPVLKGVTFDICKNERIGVVGRTGAGKSSLTLALFRFLEARGGSIQIDGLDISNIKLHDLRSRLAIIPQDPVLFSGNIRSNLDPFDQHTDAALIDCLRRVHLIPEFGTTTPNPTLTLPTSLGDAIGVGKTKKTKLVPNAEQQISGTSTPHNPKFNLDTPVSEGGLNLSQGQRQLLCLARAIVSRPKVMILDEATSAVDMSTDALIQSSIRHEFSSSTLLVIAHRLSTIADFDRILVLSDGTVDEYGTPQELWGSEEQEKEKWGTFRSMCEESGERDKLKNAIFGGN